MSLLPVISHANATQPCWASASGGGGGGNPTFDSVIFTPSAPPPILSDQIASGVEAYNSAPQVSIYNSATGYLGPLQVGNYIQIQGGSSAPSQAEPRMEFTDSDISWVQANTGTSFFIIQKDPDPATTFALTNISSVNGVPYFPPAYASYSSTQTQVIPALTATPLSYDTADVTAVNMSAGALPSASITVVDSGVYKVTTCVHALRTGAAGALLNLWLSVNGTPVTNSGARILVAQNVEQILTYEWLVSVPPGAALSVVAYSPVVDNEANAVPLANPIIPSVRTNVTRVG